MPSTRPVTALHEAVILSCTRPGAGGPTRFVAWPPGSKHATRRAGLAMVPLSDLRACARWDFKRDWFVDFCKEQGIEPEETKVSSSLLKTSGGRQVFLTLAESVALMDHLKKQTRQDTFRAAALATSAWLNGPAREQVKEWLASLTRDRLPLKDPDLFPVPIDADEGTPIPLDRLVEQARFHLERLIAGATIGTADLSDRETLKGLLDRGADPLGLFEELSALVRERNAPA